VAVISAAKYEIRVRFSRDDKGEAGASIQYWLVGSTEQQVPLLRFAPVGMTIFVVVPAAPSLSIGCRIGRTAGPSTTLRFGPNEQLYR
jgi:hypothetical protein